MPGDDPPFVTVCFPDSDKEVSIRTRAGRELVRRLEERGGHSALVARIFAARRGRFPQRFVTEGDDEAVLLAALDDAPELAAGRLAELRELLRRRTSAT